MDINSLLSPSDNPRSNPPTPAQSPHSHVQRSNSGKPPPPTSLARSILPPSSIPAHIRSPSQQPSHSSPLISPVPTGSVPTFPRTSSTPSMDTLADLASMQTHQPLRSTPPISSDSNDTHHSLHRSTIGSTISSAITSNPRASFDIAMVETPRESLRGDYTGSSLSSDMQQRLAELVGYIAKTPSAYDAHIEIIKILHHGFVSHIYPSASPSARMDPKAYDLLSDLRQVREHADKLFAVGEDQWLDWLQDESILAQSAEERLEVIEKCRRAVEEEYGSSKLWSTYGDWVRHCFDWANDQGAEADQERLVGRELFTWDNVMNVWEQGVDQTKHDMGQSHLVWDKFIRARFPSLDEKMTSDQANLAVKMFQERLRIPHTAWDNTFQTFSSFVSANFSNQDYERFMEQTSYESAPAKSIYRDRESFESTLATALASNDKYAEYQAFSSYLEWEKTQELKVRHIKNKRKLNDPVVKTVHSGMLVHTLLQRAELRLASVVAVWEEHVQFMITKRISGVRDVLSCATKHCPWSGNLWKQQLLSAEIADSPYVAVEAIKHNATKNGMLDAAGIEEVMKVHDAWCGYLLRRARKAEDEDDVDIAEMGIRTSIEAVQSLASELNLEADFDSSFRLQRKYIEYLKNQSRLDNARKQFDDAIPTYGSNYRFWLRFYEFELQKSIHFNALQQSKNDGGHLNSSAPFAVAILKHGLEQKVLDYPEYLVETLITHCEDYEDADELQAALMLCKRVESQITAKRQLEAEQAQEEIAKPIVQEIAEERTEEVASNLHIGKRKRDDEEMEADQNKRVKGDEPAPTVEAAPSATEELKRDREHASVLVRNIPVETIDSTIRDFFRSCGDIVSLKALQDEDNGVIIEFKEADGANYAVSRDGLELEGAIISVVLNTGSTLYITNYPPAADESFIRNLFQPYGEIVNIRFPSLQGNKKRRFCYVEMKTPDTAQKALELDGQEHEGLPLSVHISDPGRRKERDTTNKHDQNDEHVIFVGGIRFTATEEQIEKTFSKFGAIDLVRMPRDVRDKSRNKGIAFIRFEDVAHAQAALEMDGQKFQGRNIKVRRADNDSRSSIGRSVSPTTSPGQSNRANGTGRRPSSASNHAPGGESTSAQTASTGSRSALSKEQIEERKSRTIALINVPDTVNEARLRAAAEKIGPIVKVMLRTNHQGALVEFESASDAGKAALELDEYEITPDRKIRVVSEAELNAQAPEKKFEKKPKTPAAPMVPGAIRRPGQTQAGQRRGGHLGQKKGLGYGGIAGKVNGEPGAVTNDGKRDGGVKVEKKSNDDFRKMIGGS